ncbi:MAG: VCBS repeat-containing protein [Saprospiraceae bacterium]|nr:VCBS repeat-containing protein [Saprospiraceae bacterium]
MANQTNSPASIINNPKGGGAMHGLGEKFSPDLFTGTGNFTVPIALSPGRNGFQPQINLSYSTGQGNGPFGMGWSLSIPGVARQTSKGIPKYDEQKDTFILSGAEDLVPVERSPGNGYSAYRPRTEGLFARIRYYLDDKNAYWEVKTKDGLTSIYGTPASVGKNDQAACVNPDYRSNIFAWKLTQTTDPFGNQIKYTYEHDTGSEGPHYWDQVYLRKIEYIDYTSKSGKEQFLASVEFEYDKNRPDAFSDYKSGFEIRTRWRCQSILIETHPEGIANAVKVRRYVFNYDNSAKNDVSLLVGVQVTGFDDTGAEISEMPPLDFRYSKFDPQEKRDFFPVTGNDLPPVALSNPDFEIADLTGNGLPDIFQLNGVARFWKNMGNGRYDPPRMLKDRPPVSLSDPGVQMLDADGDGRIDLLVTNGAFSGYFPMEYGRDAAWEKRPFTKYRQAPSFDLKDPEVKLVDLTGDGITDIIRSGTRLECFFNDPKEGWNETRFWPRKSNLAEFPNVQFSDSRVKWADMTGDTMQDIALVHDGNVEYYPNLGYGRWGKRIHMRNSPRFPYGYDPRRILLGDVDGDGLADLIYVDDRQITLWVNQSGNQWSDPIVIPGTPPVSDMDSVRLIDLKGSGVAGILWSSDLRGDGRPHMFFLDLTGGGKPYVLNEMDNNIGAVTKVEYVSSAEFYLMDEQDRNLRWQTSLPMPVQVVKKVEVIDAISQTKLTTAYRYHHGYWDGLEREFRGFGMVEQTDTLTESDYNAAGLHGDVYFEKVLQAQFSPPIRTKTWFHQGPVRIKGNTWLETDYSQEYWQGDPGFWDKGQMLQDLLRNSELLAHDKRDALRALRGSILRTELYALDGTERGNNPYTVTESRYDVQKVDNPLQEEGLKPVYFPTAVSQRTTQWERGDDPMTQFVFTADYDHFGQPQVQTQIACYRGWKKLGDRAGEFLATRTRTTYAIPALQDHYIHDRVAGVKQWEIVNTLGKTVEEIAQLVDGSSMKIFGHSLTYYDGKAYQGRPWKEVGKFGAATRIEALVLTTEILKEAYEDTLYNGQKPVFFNDGNQIQWTAEYNNRFQLSSKGIGYTFHLGTGQVYERGYYITTERKKYDFQAGAGNKGLPVAILDPLADNSVEPNNHKTSIEYEKYKLLPKKVIQVMSTPPAGIKGLEMKAEYNYRVFQPRKITDPNGNETIFEYSPSGLHTATRLKGQPGKNEGDQARASAILDYNFFNFKIAGDPIWVKTTKHIHHDTETDIPEPKRSETITTIEYSDGFGRVVQTRTQAEEEIFGDPLFGGDILITDQNDKPGSKSDVICTINNNPNDPNVVVSGWQVYDNKGQVIEKFEPFFATGWDYQPPTLIQRGKSIRMEYDPRGQVIRTLNPDGSMQWVIYGTPIALDTPGDFNPTPWEAYTYDANDLASLSRTPGGASMQNQAPQSHHFTPAHIEIDALGRTIKAVQRLAMSNAPGDLVVTKSEYDIRGNLVKIFDALGRRAFFHAYDLANRPLLIDSIDAGIRTTIYNASGNPVERRDKRGALILQTYDDLNRPDLKWASDKTGQAITLREQMTYGENAPNAAKNNLRGKLYQHKDEAGLLSFHAYDFKGNILEKAREVVSDTVISTALTNGIPFVMDWDNRPSLYKAHITTTAYDALNRVKKITYPEDTRGKRRELEPEYNRAGALEKVVFDGSTYVDRIAYNAKGQRILIAYGNQVMTRYAYDPLTFRLLRLRTEKYTAPVVQIYRPDGSPFQDFFYQYDLVGNIISIRDVTKNCGIPNTRLGDDELLREFTYDAIYRLRTATGRECDKAPPPTGNSKIDAWLQMGYCDDPTRTRAYTQEYQYDEMGNMTHLIHQAGGANNYNKDYVTLPTSNRLQNGTFRGQQFDYLYDDNGNLEQESLSRFYEWDHSDHLIRFRVQAPTAAMPSQQTSYLYDAAGMRVKKLVRKQNGAWESRTYIDGVFEHTKNNTGKKNNHFHVMDNQSRIAILRTGDAIGDTWPEVQYHLGDHLGSSNTVLGGKDASVSAFVGREEYYPYSDTSFGNFSKTKKRFRYSGKEKDEESGLYYYGARYYAGWLGRWVSCDPIGKKDNLNLYLFTQVNPINRIDLLGHESPGVAEIRDERGRYSPERITEFRNYINTVKTPKERAVLFGFLQKKVGYHSQRDNLFTEVTYNSKKVDTKMIGDVMCNLTSLAMSLEYLGVPNPKGRSWQYEDALESIRYDSGLPKRTSSDGWGGVAAKLGVKVTFLDYSFGKNSNKNWFEQTVKPELDQGKAVMMSIGGHIIRVQAITDQGIVVDDPYGRSTLGKEGNRSFARNNSEKNPNAGEDTFYSWADVEKHKMNWVATLEINTQNTQPKEQKKGKKAK